MKKNIILSAIIMMCLVLTGTLSFTACSNDDLDTNQYGSGVSLNVYGPTPVMRGGELRFLGSNLDQVAQVVLPGCDPITAIDIVKSGVPSEIKITVPVDGPEPGRVKLITTAGLEIETITPLNYIEPIVVNEITPALAMPGDVITVKGDYLNLVHAIGFEADVLVSDSDFVAHSRYEIKLTVPETARTGKLSFYDADLTDPEFDPSKATYNTIESAMALSVGTHTVTKVASPRGAVDALGTVVAKQGETITVTGAHLHLVDSVTFGGDGNVFGINRKALNVAADRGTLTLTLPAEAPDGDLLLITRSGVAVPAAKIQTVTPSELAATPSPVKNGALVTIAGKDLDVVKSVTFPNCEAIDVTSAATLKVTVPETAQEGDITLTMVNGKTVTVAYLLVKPTVSAYSVNPVSAGGALSIRGANLDLVSKVTFKGSETPVEVAATGNGTAINLTVPMDAQSGPVTLNLKNGSDVAVTEIQINEAVFCYATTLPDAETEIHAGETFTLPVKNADKLTGVEINGTACQYILSGGNLIVGVPDNAKKGSKVRLISTNGEITYTIDFIPNTEITTVIWTGLHPAGGWANGMTALSWGAYDWSKVAPGTELVVTFTVDPAKEYGCQMRFGNGSWAALPGTKAFEGADGDGNIAMPDDAKEYRFALTQEMIDEMVANGGLVICGAWFILTKVALVEHISLEQVLWTGTAVADDWGNQPTLLSDGGAELLAAGAKAGQTLRFYITPTDAAWNLQIVEGHWGPTYCDFNQDNYDLAAHKGAVELTLTADMLTAAITQQWWGGGFILNGDNVVCTKITIE